MIRIPYDGGSPLVQAINTNFAQVEASLSPLITNGGSNMLWSGYPLTGVSFSTSFVTVANAVVQTVAANPIGSGVRMLVEVYYNNLGVATSYSEYKSNGTLTFPLNAGIGVAVNAFGSGSYPAWLEPGESFVLTCPNSLLFAVNVMSFNLSCSLKTIFMWGGVAAGANIIYTCPPNTSAFLIRPQTLTAPFLQASPFIDISNFDTVNITYTVSVAGTTWTALGALSPGQGTIYPVPSVLTAGQQITVTASAASTGNTTIFCPVWERPN
jgi:hypothetical protein